MSWELAYITEIDWRSLLYILTRRMIRRAVQESGTDEGCGDFEIIAFATISSGEEAEEILQSFFYSAELAAFGNFNVSGRYTKLRSSVRNWTRPVATCL